MNQAEIQALFRRFASPLAKFVDLGCSKDSAEELARNLWMAMLGGPESEQRVFEAMRQTDSELLSVLTSCYEVEMKAAVSPQELAAVRRHYGIAPPDGDPGCDSS